MDKNIILKIICCFILMVPTSFSAVMCFIGKEDNNKKLIKKYLPIFIIFGTMLFVFYILVIA